MSLLPTQEGRTNLLKLAGLLRELFNSDDYRTVCTYSDHIASLQDAHDEAAKHPKGSPENYRLYGIATKTYRIALSYAIKNGLPRPNDVLAECGYGVRP